MGAVIIRSRKTTWAGDSGEIHHHAFNGAVIIRSRKSNERGGQVGMASMGAVIRRPERYPRRCFAPKRTLQAAVICDHGKNP